MATIDVEIGQRLAATNDIGAGVATATDFFAIAIARNMLAVRNDVYCHAIQESLAGRRVASWSANGSLTLVAFGATHTISGTHTVPALAITNSLSHIARNRFVSQISANAGAGLRETFAGWHRSSDSTRGGFYYSCLFGFQNFAATTGTRAFIGLAATTILATSSEPSVLADCVGIGWDGSDVAGNMFLFHNDSAGICSKIDLGASFVRQNNARYQASFYAPPNTAEIWYHVQIHGINGSGDAIASGSITTNLPTNTTFLCTHEVVGAGASAAAIVIEIGAIYCEVLL